MLIVALVMAVIGLAALVTAVVTSNEVIAWVCIGASVIGVLLLIVDALRERQRRDAETVAEPPVHEPDEAAFEAEYPEDDHAEQAAVQTAAADTGTEEAPTAEAATEDSGRERP